MFLLSMEDQQKVLTQYQKDYGSLILEYNKCRNNIGSILKLKNKATSLCEEIQSSTHFHKKFFSEENSNFAENIIYEIKSFINHYLNWDEAEDNIHLYFYTSGTNYCNNFASA